MNLVVIKTGPGIGAGIVMDGGLWQGDGFGAGEVGHVRVVDNGPRCNCGHYGCLEAVASTTAIVERAQTAARSDRKSMLRKLAPSLAQLTFDDVVAAADQGDAAALTVVRETGNYFGKAIANLVGGFNIRHIVIAGSLTRFGKPLRGQIEATMRQSALGVLADSTEVEFSELGNDIVILGASALLLNNELGINSLR
jgi:predicted NBD/HSP70 family sugar kinase